MNATPPEPGGERVVAMLRLSGELSLKGRRTRRRFQRTLARNLRDACESHGLGFELEEGWSRMYVTTTGGDPSEPLSRVFGVSSWSPIDAVVPARLPDIVDAGTRLYADRVTGNSYAVRARRSGLHEFRSSDVMQELGAALNSGATVDLDAPEVEVHVEVRDELAYLFSERHAGAGGLPLGAESRGVALLSGGFDSPVAAWQLLRRGVGLDYVFCNLGGDAYRRMVIDVAKVLADGWHYGTSPRLYVVDFAPVVEELRREIRAPYLQVALKRQMYRAAEAVAELTGADALVTGEAVGQVSSQTLANLRATDVAAERPVLRPLVGMDKESIVALSRRVGTHDLSARVREYCSIGDGPTATGARPETLAREEESLDPELLAGLVSAAAVVKLRGLRVGRLAAAGLFVDFVPGGALIVELVDEHGAEAGPAGETTLPADALRRTVDELEAERREFDPARTVVFVCTQGMISAQVAERWQRSGFEAYSLRGGTRRLQRLAESAP